MPFSYKDYTGDGSTTTFSITFDYQKESEISVTVDGVAQSGFTFPSSTQVQLTSAPASSTLVRIRRTTDLDAREVDFASGSVLTEEDLDNSNIQVFHAAQEAIDTSNDAISLDDDDKWDAQSKVIKNVAAPVNGTDAANKTYIDTQTTSAATSATNAATSATAAQTAQTAAETAQTAAETAQTAAETAETNAETAETNAETAQTAAETAQTAAETAKTGAETAKTGAETAQTAAETAQTAAETAQTAAETAETNAETAETNAQGHENTAQDWATKTNGEAQTGEGYSAKAWATGGTGVTDTAGSGSAKEWATDTTNTCDGTEFSAKEYAIGSQAGNTNGSAKQWAIGGGASYSTNTTVDGTNYSAKYWAEQAAASVDSFDDTYLGSKSSDPTLDNDGNALATGALYFSTTANKLRVYDGTQWNDAVTDTTGFATAGYSIAMSIAL